jgi:hypothetical protein
MRTIYDAAKVVNNLTIKADSVAPAETLREVDRYSIGDPDVARCPFAHYAAMRARIAAFVEMRDIRLAVPAAELQQLPLPFHRGLGNLPLRFTPIKGA